jgi:hypothetical protein
MKPFLDELGGLSPKIRAAAENKLRGLQKQFDNDDNQLREKEPNFYNKSTQGKFYDLVEFMQQDAHVIVNKAKEAQKTKDLADQYKRARDHSQKGKDREHDRER